MIRYAAFNDVNLELENGQRVNDPTPEQISRLLATLDGDGNSFAILAIDKMNYVQTSGGVVAGFLVEYQEGTLREHFGSARHDLPLSKVDSIFRAYSLGDASWKTMVDWTRLDLAVPSQATAVYVAWLLVAWALVSFAMRWWKNAA